MHLKGPSGRHHEACHRHVSEDVRKNASQKEKKVKLTWKRPTIVSDLKIELGRDKQKERVKSSVIEMFHKWLCEGLCKHEQYEHYLIFFEDFLKINSFSGFVQIWARQWSADTLDTRTLHLRLRLPLHPGRHVCRLVVEPDDICVAWCRLSPQQRLLARNILS